MTSQYILTTQYATPLRNGWSVDPAARRRQVDGTIRYTVGDQIRAMRRARRWSHADLSERTDIAVELLLDIEAYGVERASSSDLLRIASAFDCALTIRFAAFSTVLPYELDKAPHVGEDYEHDAGLSQ